MENLDWRKEDRRKKGMGERWNSIWKSELLKDKILI